MLDIVLGSLFESLAVSVLTLASLYLFKVGGGPPTRDILPLLGFAFTHKFFIYSLSFASLAGF